MIPAILLLPPLILLLLCFVQRQRPLIVVAAVATNLLLCSQWWWAPVLILGGLLTAAYAFLMLSYAFQPDEGEPLRRRPRRLMEITALALAMASVLLGMRVQEPMQLLEPHSPTAAEWEGEP
ncbi:MAG: hypothetical protein WD490_00220 [Opitutales bacterium]